MDVLLFCINGVLPVMLLMLFGYVCRLTKLIDDELIHKCARLCTKALIPASIFNSIRKANLMLYFDTGFLAFGLGGVILSTVLAILLVPRFVKDRARCGTIVHTLFRPNFSMLGLPLSISLFGDAGGVYAAMLMPFVVTYLNLVAVPVLSRYHDEPDGHKRRFTEMLPGIVKNPLIIAALLGLVLSLLQIQLPSALGKAVDNMGLLGQTFALLLLGGQFSFHSLKKGLTPALLTTLTRLVVQPALYIGTAILFGFRGAQLGVLFVLFGSPAAAMTYILAHSFHTDEQLAGQIVVLSTMLCCFTIFVGTFLLRITGMM